MIDIDAELLDLDAGWREVLEAYQMAEETGDVDPKGAIKFLAQLKEEKGKE